MSPIERDCLIESELALIQQQTDVSDALPDDVKQVLNCLHELLFEEAHNINTIIEQCGAQKATIYGRFALYVGVSIRTYREGLRMKVARRLLACEDLEIYRIADRLGYKNYTSFARAFRKLEGCSPAVYREEMCREKV